MVELFLNLSIACKRQIYFFVFFCTFLYFFVLMAPYFFQIVQKKVVQKNTKKYKKNMHSPPLIGTVSPIDSHGMAFFQVIELKG